MIQQDPKPEAQEPETVPPLPMHSEDDRHVPFEPVVSELHSKLGKVTIEKRLKITVKITKALKSDLQT